ncbi:serine hydrolase domain-containing protein [Roseicyclus persicicus]|uniref:Beta-lactamase family protein n=1 Tax=Roseicyclus persicicus TaxID=2650661 RepID=A0A7X6H0C3_9RHOB|nr:serine hydrolase domain-containing protein [Roseibacterium persicicum]NKX45696.1 beta-lactamase family protein [Roseibacterium persicicum]
MPDARSVLALCASVCAPVRSAAGFGRPLRRVARALLVASRGGLRGPWPCDEGPAANGGRHRGRVGRWLAAAVLALAPGAAGADTAALAERLAGTVPARLAADGVPGAVVVVIAGGRPVWTGAFGLADPARGRAMTADTLFRVESLSKPVAAWGALRLAETGRLDLDAPVAACLPGWAGPGLPPVTARQLMSHRAGLAVGDYAARHAPGAPRPDLATHLAGDIRWIAAPGAGFAYSDTGYHLLELAMEGCAGAPFPALMGTEVLGPLGMATARFGAPGGGMAVGHDLRGRPVAPYVYPGYASGGLIAGAADIARFAAAGMAGAGQGVLSPAGVAALHRAEGPVTGLFAAVAEGYGLGHFTETLSDGRRAVWHGGQGYGWMSHMHLVPETGDGIVILSNGQRAWPLFAAVLRAWSDSLGVAPVGMARVLWAEAAARVAIGALVALALLAAWAGLRRRRGAGVRVLAGAAAVPLAGWGLWAAAQDYLFLFSILPGLWPWLAGASGVAALGCAAAALAPSRRD